MPRMAALHAFRHCTNLLADKGLSVSEEAFGPDLVGEMGEIGKAAPSPQLSYELSDLTPANSFWLGLRRSGKLVGTVAARLDDLGDYDPSIFIERSLSRYWCTGKDASVRVRIPPHCRTLKGAVIYMGDLFLAPEEVGDKEKTFCLMHCAHAAAFLTWPKAEAVYAFMRMSDYLEKGNLYGFTSSSYINVASWQNPPLYRSEHEALCILTRQDFLYNMGRLSESPAIFRDLPKRRSRSERKQAQTHSQ